MMPMPPQQPRLCATCLAARAQWEVSHRAEVETMIAAVQEAQQAGRQPDQSVLPAGMPPVQPSVTAIGGTEYCAGHIPGIQGGRPPLLIAQGALSPAAMTQLGGMG